MNKDISIKYTSSAGSGEFSAYLVAPKEKDKGKEKNKKYPDSILIEEIWGVDAHIRGVCERFQPRGLRRSVSGTSWRHGHLRKDKSIDFRRDGDPEKLWQHRQKCAIL